MAEIPQSAVEETTLLAVSVNNLSDKDRESFEC